MCGRYGFDPGDDFNDRFEIENPQQLAAHFNVKPEQTMPVVVQHSPNHVEMMTWGFLPSWSKRAIINATAEKVPSSSLFRKAFQERRCLVPASGFYEWKATATGKQPYYIRLKDEKLFAFAGLYGVWKDREGKERTCYTIITTTPNSLMEPIHNRMPVILQREDEAAWLNPDTVETKELETLLVPYPAEKMEAYPVSRDVNYPRNDSAALIKSIEL